MRRAAGSHARGAGHKKREAAGSCCTGEASRDNSPTAQGKAGVRPAFQAGRVKGRVLEEAAVAKIYVAMG